MKCPKCRYLSFEPELRCKHCGYDFSLAESSAPRPTFDELEQQDPDMPMVDLQLRSVEIDTSPAPPPLPAVSRVRLHPEPAPVRRPVAAAVAVAERVDKEPTPGLPLFLKKGVVSEPVTDADLLLTALDDPEQEESPLRVPAAPRPLVVRRAPEPPPITAPRVLVQPRPVPAPPVTVATVGEVDAPARLKAAAVDLGILLALNVTVILLTLRQCDLPVTGVMQLPMIPLVGFLASLTVGYLLMFNVVSARSIGKMIFGLHVVADSDEGDVELAPTQRQLSYRALLTVPSVLLLGLGFLPGLVGEGLAIHDRLTHTRVVRG